MTGRSVPEWIGKTPDTPIPPRVRIRVLERHNRTCHLSGRPIRSGDPWDCDHIKALVNGGEHRESNLAPALKDKHREKSREDLAEKSKVYRKKAAAYGVKRKGRSLTHPTLKRKFDGSVVAR